MIRPVPGYDDPVSVPRLDWGDMQETSPAGNGPTTQSDSRAVETPSTPTKAPASVQDAGPQQFPPTLVGLDPPTLPAADGLAPPHRDVDNRGPGDLPQFRPFPHPQRSVPGHPQLRRGWRRLLTFWRRSPA